MLVIRRTEGSIITGTSYDMDLLILPGSRAENIDTFIPDVYKPDEKSIILVDRMGGGLTAAIQALEEYARFLEGWKTGMVSFCIHKSEIPEFIAIILCSPG